MPGRLITSKKDVEAKSEAIKTLQEKCRSCKCFHRRTAESIYLYEIWDEDYSAILAVAEYGQNTYAIYAPDNMTEEQLHIFGHFLSDIDGNIRNVVNGENKVVVFSQRSYDAAKKYKHIRPMSVELHV